MQTKSVRRPHFGALGAVKPKFRVSRLFMWEAITPGIKPALESSPRRAFPLGFGRQPVRLAGTRSEPLAIGDCVEPVHTGDRLVRMIESRVAPSRRDYVGGLLKKEMIQTIRDSRATHPEAFDAHAVNRALVFGSRVAAHEEGACGDDDYFSYDCGGRHFLQATREGGTASATPATSGRPTPALKRLQ